MEVDEEGQPASAEAAVAEPQQEAPAQHSPPPETSGDQGRSLAGLTYRDDEREAEAASATAPEPALVPACGACPNTSPVRPVLRVCQSNLKSEH